ncbi:hypothetical protein D3C78_1727280 [compost metagenome]
MRGFLLLQNHPYLRPDPLPYVCSALLDQCGVMLEFFVGLSELHIDALADLDSDCLPNHFGNLRVRQIKNVYVRMILVELG